MAECTLSEITEDPPSPAFPFVIKATDAPSSLAEWLQPKLPGHRRLPIRHIGHIVTQSSIQPAP